jgi:hypothetical protein
VTFPNRTQTRITFGRGLVPFILLGVTFIGLVFTDHSSASGQVSSGTLPFPNATSVMPGNLQIIPGLHVMSLVNGVKLTWIIISSDKELSVNLRYSGNETLTPAVSLVATALKSPSNASTLGPAVNSSFIRAEGSNATASGWISPATVPIKLEGDMSLYDADLIIVMVVPNTAPPAVSNATSSVPQ